MKRLVAALALALLLGACDRAAPVSADAAASAAADQLDPRRVLKLEGGKNFRDLGGYRTADGRSVKWRTVFRSGSPADLTENDFKMLRALGIRTVCDFRDNAERESEPNRFVEAGNVDYWTRDYTLDMSELKAALTAKHPTRAATRAAIIAFYRRMPDDHAASFAAMFARLAKGEVPLAFNCSAGKDRAGMGAALMLYLLGVPRATILEDYALSDDVVDYRAELEEEAKRDPGASIFAKLPWDVVEPLFASDPAYLETAFAAIEQEYGSVDRFIELRLGVTPAMQAGIRNTLLEPVSG